MKVNLIIGAGQLGSRHLQGLLKWEGPQKIYVVDPSTTSLNVTKERSMEVEHNHEIIFLEDIQSIPSEIDLAIIATNANIREAVIKSLLATANVKYLILEKVLFDNVEAYQNIGTLLKYRGIRTWVNHPRRMFEHYIDIKKELDFGTGNNQFKIAGSDWGLGCNGLHFLDMISFLTNANIESVETDDLDKEIVASKRNGFVEFTGTLKGKLEDGSRFEISSLKNSGLPVSVDIILPELDCKVTESIVKVEYIFNEDGARNTEKKYQPVYQSGLTANLAKSLFETDDCALPTLKAATVNHLVFIKALMKFEEEITGEKSDKLKIT